MAAESDIDPPRHWRQTNPARPGDRLIYAAMSKWRAVIATGRFEINPHARVRMQERGIALEEVLLAAQNGRIIPASRTREGDDIYGGYLAGELMIIVGARAPHGVDFADLIPTVRTLFRTEPLDSAQPLIVPVKWLCR